MLWLGKFEKRIFALIGKALGNGWMIAQIA
jgi:hypothetical protein